MLKWSFRGAGWRPCSRGSKPLGTVQDPCNLNYYVEYAGYTGIAGDRGIFGPPAIDPSPEPAAVTELYRRQNRPLGRPRPSWNGIDHPHVPPAPPSGSTEELPLPATDPEPDAAAPSINFEGCGATRRAAAVKCGEALTEKHFCRGGMLDPVGPSGVHSVGLV